MCRLDRARRLSCLAFAAALLLAFVPSPGRAAETSASGTSLGKVPADAEAYGAFLRMGETIEIIGKSRAWRMLWNHPDVQELWKKGLAGWENEPNDRGFKKFLADPANKELPALVGDAFSNEAFIYAGAGWSDLINLAQEMIGGVRFGSVFQKLLGANKEDATRARIRILLQTLAEKPDRLRVPDVVIGLKVSDPAKVAAQLKRLDPLLADALKETPFKGRSERVKVGGDEFLVLKLDGSLIPWDEIPIGMFEDKKGEFAPLMNHLKKMKVSVAVSVRQGYLLIAMGESPQQLLKFGGEGPKLADRPEFKPLEKHAGRPLTSIGYTSAKLRQALATSAEDVIGIGELVKEGLKEAELPEVDRKAIEKDIDVLARLIARGVEKPGAEANFSFRTARGWETFAFDYTKPDAGPRRPLTLLNHLGGNPLLAVVWRSGTTVDDYRALVKWVTVFGKHAEKVAAAKAPNGAEMVKKFRAEILPLLIELSDITEKNWLPALADGQQAFVLDAKWTSKQWHTMMPEAETRLPMLELGIVLGVSNSAKLEKALEGYRVVGNKLLAKGREQVPAGVVPDFVEIPKPQVERKGGRTFAHYPIPAEWGIDPQFQPTGGLSDKVAALTLSRGHAERLLTATPLKSDTPLLADSKRPLDSMFHFNWAGMVDTAAPWVQYGMRLANAPEQSEQFARKVVRVLKVFWGYTSITYREEGATVTHSEAVFRDIDPKLD